MRIPYADIEGHIPDTVGQQVHINHDACPAGVDSKRRLYIRRTDVAVLAYCHNCNGHYVKSGAGKVRHQDVLRKLLKQTEQLEATASEVMLPDDIELAPHMFPHKAASWLYEAQLTDTDIKRFKIGYSPSWGRVILPVYEEDKLVFWQGRRIEGDGPKYISVKGAKKPLFIAQPPMKHGQNNYLVIVEDMLSAIRLSSWGGAVTGMALLGTDELDTIADELRKYAHVAVWLDNDVAGRSKAANLFERVRLLAKPGAGIINIHEDEPKRLSSDNVRKILNKRPNLVYA